MCVSVCGVEKKANPQAGLTHGRPLSFPHHHPTPLVSSTAATTLVRCAPAVAVAAAAAVAITTPGRTAVPGVEGRWLGTKDLPPPTSHSRKERLAFWNPLRHWQLLSARTRSLP